MTSDSPMVRRILWNLVPLALVVGAVASTLMGEEGLLNRHALKQRLYGLQDQVVALEGRNGELRGDIRALRTDPELVKRAAAEKLLAAEPGSTIYRFAPEHGS